MSTYLIALVISDFQCKYNNVEGVGEFGSVKVGVCGRSNALDQLDYALQIGTKIIKYLEEFYGVKYPLPKCGK